MTIKNIYLIDQNCNIFDLYLILNKFLKSEFQEVFQVFYSMNTDDELLLEAAGIIEDIFNCTFSMMEGIEKSLQYLNNDNCIKRAFLFREIDCRSSQKFEYALMNQFDYDDGSNRCPKQPLNTEKTHEIGLVYQNSESYLDRKYEDEHDSDVFFKLQKQLGKQIEKFQENLFVILPSEDGIVGKYFVLNEEKVSFEGEKTLKVGLFPLSSRKDLLKLETTEVHFEITGIENEEILLEQYMSMLQRADDSDVDIAIFPEMLLTRHILKTLKRLIKEEISIPLIVAGTIWENNSNRCELVFSNGHNLEAQHKINPFISGELSEKLIPSIPQINFYDIKGLGIACFPICADFTVNNTYEVIKKHLPDYIFVPAYTGSLSLFKRNAAKIGDGYHSSIFISNACCKIGGNGSVVSYSYLPIKDGQEEHTCDNATCNGTCESIFMVNL